MLGYAAPPGYQRKEPVKRPKLEAFLGVIDQILEKDKQQIRKQRHTAKRIFERLRQEHGYLGGNTVGGGLLCDDHPNQEYPPKRKLTRPLK